MQHLGHFTFFSALLVAIERAAGDTAAATAGAAAADCLYQTVVQMRGELLQRLAALAHSPPHMIAVEHFSLLAQVRPQSLLLRGSQHMRYLPTSSQCKKLPNPFSPPPHTGCKSCVHGRHASAPCTVFSLVTAPHCPVSARTMAMLLSRHM